VSEKHSKENVGNLGGGPVTTVCGGARSMRIEWRNRGAGVWPVLFHAGLEKKAAQTDGSERNRSEEERDPQNFSGRVRGEGNWAWPK